MVEIVQNFQIKIYFLSISKPAISSWHQIQNISLLPFLFSPEMDPSKILFFSIIEEWSWNLLNYSVAHGRKRSSIFPFCVSLTVLSGTCIIKKLFVSEANGNESEFSWGLYLLSNKGLFLSGVSCTGASHTETSEKCYSLFSNIGECYLSEVTVLHARRGSDLPLDEVNLQAKHSGACYAMSLDASKSITSKHQRTDPHPDLWRGCSSFHLCLEFTFSLKKLRSCESANFSFNWPVPFSEYSWRSMFSIWRLQKPLPWHLCITTFPYRAKPSWVLFKIGVIFLKHPWYLAGI